MYPYSKMKRQCQKNMLYHSKTSSHFPNLAQPPHVPARHFFRCSWPSRISSGKRPPRARSTRTYVGYHSDHSVSSHWEFCYVLLSSQGVPCHLLAAAARLDCWSGGLRLCVGVGLGGGLVFGIRRLLVFFKALLQQLGSLPEFLGGLIRLFTCVLNA